MDSTIENHEAARPQPGDIRSFFCPPSSKRPRTACRPLVPAGSFAGQGAADIQVLGAGTRLPAPQLGAIPVPAWMPPPSRASAARPSVLSEDPPADAEAARPPAQPLDEEAAVTWVYPTNMPVRPYQHSITKTALLHNTLVNSRPAACSLCPSAGEASLQMLRQPAPLLPVRAGVPAHRHGQDADRCGRHVQLLPLVPDRARRLFSADQASGSSAGWRHPSVGRSVSICVRGADGADEGGGAAEGVEVGPLLLPHPADVCERS
jgi:hypothetical protein